jgi:hypothetical protein
VVGFISLERKARAGLNGNELTKESLRHPSIRPTRKTRRQDSILTDE